MFVTMNRLTIAREHWEEFEERFKKRAGLVDQQPGFIRNALLRPVEGTTDQHIVMTLWESREAFEAWTRSEAFHKAHANAGRIPESWFAGPGKLEAFEAVTDSEADATKRKA